MLDPVGNIGAVHKNAPNYTGLKQFLDGETLNLSKEGEQATASPQRNLRHKKQRNHVQHYPGR